MIKNFCIILLPVIIGTSDQLQGMTSGIEIYTVATPTSEKLNQVSTKGIELVTTFGPHIFLAVVSASIFCKQTADTNDTATLRKVCSGSLLGVGLGELARAWYQKNIKAKLIAGGLLAFAALLTTQKDALLLCNRLPGYSLNPSLTTKQKISEKKSHEIVSISERTHKATLTARQQTQSWLMRGIQKVLKLLQTQDEERLYFRGKKTITEWHLVFEVLPYLRTLQNLQDIKENSTIPVFTNDPTQTIELPSSLILSYLNKEESSSDDGSLYNKDLYD